MIQAINRTHDHKTASTFAIIIVAALLGALLVFATGCSGESAEPESYDLDAASTSNGVTISHPSDWETEKLETDDTIGDTWQIKPPNGGVVQLATVVNTNLSADDFVSQFLEAFGANKDYAYSIGDTATRNVSGHTVYEAPFTANIDNTKLSGTISLVAYDYFYTSCIVAAPDDASDAVKTAMAEITDSIAIGSSERHTVTFKNADGSVIESKGAFDYGCGADTTCPTTDQAGTALNVAGWTVPEDSGATVKDTDGMFSVRNITSDIEVTVDNSAAESDESSSESSSASSDASSTSSAESSSSSESSSGNSSAA